MAFTATEIEEINQIIRDWGKSVMGEARGLTPRNTGNLQSKLKVAFKQDGGDIIWKVAYQFPRYGVFVEQGVFGRMKIEQARQSGKLRPRPWLNATIQENFDELNQRLGQKSIALVSRAIQNALIKNTAADV
jgi:hypothetical protein